MDNTHQSSFFQGGLAEQTISTTAQRILGIGSGTGASTYSGQDRYITVTNCDATLDLFVKKVLASGTLSVTTSSYGKKLAAGEDWTFFVPKGYDLCAIRSGLSTAVVVADETPFK